MSRTYTWANLRWAMENPSVFVGEAHRIVTKLNRRHHQGKNIDAEYLTEKDWDNLIILDACRYDIFSEVNGIEGELQSCRSPASESLTFMRRNFFDRDLTDTVYVTSNPYASQIPKGTFHYVDNLYTSEWSSKAGTVLPSDVVTAALDASSRFDQKRLIIHFMQPHYPFIGTKGEDIQQPDLSFGDNKPGTDDIWLRLLYGLEDSTRVYKAYKQNLKIALEKVSGMLKHLSGKSVITSDHGNLFGERTGPIPAKGYGHPQDILVPELTTVPWLEVPWDSRRTITADPPLSQSISADDSVIEDRLEDLGYV